MRRRVLLPFALLFAGFALAGCQDQSPTAVEKPAIQASLDGAVPGEWIVVFRNDVPDAPGLARQLVASHGGRLRFTYQYALKGFAASLPDAAVIALRNNPQIAYIEPDREQHIMVQSLPTGIRRIFADANSNVGIDGTDDYRVDVDVAIIDTGIDFQQPDLNIAGGVDCTGSIFRPSCAAGGDDNHYHGTHVAGTVGALDNGIGVVGVAPGARLWAVKVLDKNGSGWSSWIIAGIDWVASHAGTIEVANMSLGGTGFNQSEYDAIQGAVNAGVAFAVAAGNNDADARNYSPGGFNNVLSVSALADFNGLPGGGAAATCRSDSDDTLADFSNWGQEIDVAAPGVCILSTYPIEKGSYGTISGTSMASPHAAGALALLASVNNPNNASDVYSLYNQIKNAGNYDWTDDSGDGIQERLLDVSSFTPKLVPTNVSNTAPTVKISAPANGSSFSANTPITFTGSATDAEQGSLTAGLTWASALDGTIGTGGSFTRTLSIGTHTVTATVTDAGGLSGSAQISITVTAVTGITLSVRAYKVRSTKYAELTWSGATTANVDVYRGTTKVTTDNDGAFIDNVPKSTTSASYKICEAASTTACSTTVTVTW